MAASQCRRGSQYPFSRRRHLPGIDVYPGWRSSHWIERGTRGDCWSRWEDPLDVDVGVLPNLDRWMPRGLGRRR